MIPCRRLAKPRVRSTHSLPARLFASGGLETASFCFFLLLGYYWLTSVSRTRELCLAAWAYAIASLLRPDGFLYSALAVAYLIVLGRTRREVGLFVGLFVTLCLP